MQQRHRQTPYMHLLGLVVLLVNKSFYVIYAHQKLCFLFIIHIVLTNWYSLSLGCSNSNLHCKPTMEWEGADEEVLSLDKFDLILARGIHFGIRRGLATVIACLVHNHHSVSPFPVSKHCQKKQKQKQKQKTL